MRSPTSNPTDGAPPKMDVQAFAVRLNELRMLQNGWLDGRGVAPSSTGIDWLLESFQQDFPVDLPLPFVYPTAEGGMQAEWTAGRHDVSLEIDVCRRTADWHALSLESSEETTRSLDLKDKASWAWIGTQVRELLKATV